MWYGHPCLYSTIMSFRIIACMHLVILFFMQLHVTDQRGSLINSVQFSAYLSKFIIKMMKTKYYNGNTILKYCFTIWYEIAQSIWSLIMVMLIKYLNSFYCDIFSFKYQNTRLQSERLNEYSFHVTLTKRKDKIIKLRGKQYLLCICYEVLTLTLQWRSAVWLFISRVS